MEIVQQFTCPCRPGFIYKTSSTFNSHKKNKLHQNYANKRKEESINATKYENEINLLNRNYERVVREKIALELKVEQLEQELLKKNPPPLKLFSRRTPPIVTITSESTNPTPSAERGGRDEVTDTSW